MDAIGRAGEQGIAMGALVDEVMAAGARAEDVEMAVWALMSRQRIVPSGFVCRLVRKRDSAGKPFDLRTYEFMLAETPADDTQLDLGLEHQP